jgi:hypothetical protein
MEYFDSLTHPNFSDNNQIYIRQIIATAVTFNGQKVDPFVPEIAQYYSPDYTIQLEDFVKRKKLIDEPSPDQLEFLNRWIGLQPKKALRLMDLSR